MMFSGSKHCPQCGAAASMPTAAQLSMLKCPRCKTEMSAMSLASIAMRECERCEGLWIEVAAFEKICADREQQSAVLGPASALTPPKYLTGTEPITVRYGPCPQCGQLMNRINFARCSGVVVDVCRGHGTWFDREELRGIVEFIRAGGLERSRQKEKREIEYERDKLRTDQRLSGPRSEIFGLPNIEDDYVSGLSAARGMLKFLID